MPDEPRHPTMSRFLERSPNAAYRDGWERTFGPKPKATPRIIRNPYPLRPGLDIRYEIPEDFTIQDLRRLTRHLSTMCSDWEPQMGVAEIAFPGERR